jgi:hypothetical protein
VRVCSPLGLEGIIQAASITVLTAFPELLEQAGLSLWTRDLRRRFWQLRYWDCGFESRSRHGCLSLCFCVVLSCVVEAFATGWSLVHQRRPTMFLNRNTKPSVWGGQGPYKDCRATDDNDDMEHTDKYWIGHFKNRMVPQNPFPRKLKKMLTNAVLRMIKSSAVIIGKYINFDTVTLQ